MPGPCGGIRTGWTHRWLGVGLNLAATAVNAAWAMVLFSAARSARSPALRGDAKHLLGDVVTSFGVVAGVALVLLTGVLRLDPLIAAATAFYVLYSGMHLIGESVGGLMDMAPSDGTVERIAAILSANGEGALEAHDIRTRQAGPHHLRAVPSGGARQHDRGIGNMAFATAWNTR